jgi:hypothetical protein
VNFPHGSARAKEAPNENEVSKQGAGKMTEMTKPTI